MRLLYILSFSICFLSVQGQDTFVDRLMREENEQSKQIASAVNRGDVPSVITFSDGGKAYPAYVGPNGRISFIESHNLGAAGTLGTFELWSGGSFGLSLDGAGLSIGVWEVGTPNRQHQELAGRVVLADGGTGQNDDHATHVCGTIGGLGINPGARGMANAVRIRAFTSASDNSEMATEGLAGMLVSNHSYGFIRGWRDGTWFGDESVSKLEDYLFGFYDSQARTWDQIAFNNPNYLICKSAGNDRGDSGEGFPPDGNGGSGFDCIAHSGVSKNVLTVGAVSKLSSYTSSSDVLMSSFSGWGPTDDGRIKPDIVGVGVNVFSSVGANTEYGNLSGTSMSSPNVAGSIVLLHELYSTIYKKFMKASSMKGLLIHTAKEAGSANGPDYKFGWGLVDIESAARFLLEENGFDTLIESSLFENTVINIPFEHIGGELKLTLVWTDPAGQVSSAQLDPVDLKLVNDLDLRIVNVADEIFYPYLLDPAIPNAPATTGDNFRDNVEQIALTAEAGSYVISISHKSSLLNGRQDFSLLISSIVEPVLETLYWIGGSGDWNDISNWSKTIDGSPGDKIPDSNSKVIFTSGASKTIVLSGISSCYSLSVLPESAVHLTGDGNQLQINSFVNIEDENFELSNSRLDFIGNAENHPLSGVINQLSLNSISVHFEGSGTWELVSGKYEDVSVSETANAKFTGGDFSIGNLLINGNGIGNLVELKNLNVSGLRSLSLSGVSRTISLTGTEFRFSSNEDMTLHLDQIEIPKIILGSSGMLSVSGHGSIIELDLNPGSILKLENSLEIGTLLVQSPSEIILDNSTLALDSISVVGALGLKLNGSGLIGSDGMRRVCAKNFTIDGISIFGETKWYLDGGLLIDGDGWNLESCENVLFADFTVESKCLNSETQFINLSTGSTSWVWNFGDGGLSNIENPTHMYDEAGSYIVTLESKDVFNNVDTWSQMIQVVDIGIQPNIIVESGGILRSSNVADSYLWFEGTVANVLSFGSFLVASAGGTYYLQLEVGDCVFVTDPFVILNIASRNDFNGPVIFPNPLNSNRINMVFDVSQDVFLSFYDLHGRFLQKIPIYESDRMLGSGEVDLPNGFYLVHIIKGNVHVSSQLLKIDRK